LQPEIQVWNIDRLVPYARNPRKNDPAVERMCSSIREFGFKIPCLVRSNGDVVDGHLRLKAARKLAINEIPVILCDEWTEAQVKAFRLMVNRSVTWAAWDEELLGLELLALKDSNFDLSLTGFDTERVCYGLELDHKYVDVVVQRWQTLSGKKAKLEDDGRTFDEIASERHGLTA
jgi:ParB-like chromosome segregation protein Spo0J